MTIYVYPDRESKNLEFKQYLPNWSQLIKTCVAFANGFGGKLIIGVEDDTRKIWGVDEETRNKIYDEFPNSLYDSTSPSLLCEIYEKQFNDVGVIIIEIPSSIKKPVFVKSEGTQKGIYIRIGSSTRRADEEYIKELFRETKRIHYDEEIIHEEIQILSKRLIKEIYPTPSIEHLLSENVITQINLAKKYYPTVAGVLMFCENPEQYIQEAIIQCTRFRGIEGRDIIQTEEIKGPIEKQLNISVELLKSWLTRNYQLKGMRLKGKSIIPEIAIRESIVNALIHRKYWIIGSIKIALYDNRLEIFSPGNFPGPLDPKLLGDGTTYLRNPSLAKIARRLGLVEKLGTGIKLIFESCAKEKIKKPEFIEGADWVKVVFYFYPEEDKKASDEEKILAIFKIDAELKIDDITESLKISRPTAIRKLNKLIQENKIVRIGKGPAVMYMLK